jgi:5,10-methylenetetrahydrofolate reductase
MSSRNAANYLPTSGRDSVPFALQSDLLGAAALGIRNLLILTGEEHRDLRRTELVSVTLLVPSSLSRRSKLSPESFQASRRLR